MRILSSTLAVSKRLITTEIRGPPSTSIGALRSDLVKSCGKGSASTRRARDGVQKLPSLLTKSATSRATSPALAACCLYRLDAASTLYPAPVRMKRSAAL